MALMKERSIAPLCKLDAVLLLKNYPRDNVTSSPKVTLTGQDSLTNTAQTPDGGH